MDRIEHVIPQDTYLGTPWHNTPCYPTLSVLCRGDLCYTTSKCCPVTLQAPLSKETLSSGITRCVKERVHSEMKISLI